MRLASIDKLSVDRDATRKLLLIASNFPPVHGGSAVVYDAIASAANGAVDVLAPRIGYADGLPLDGWLEHDRVAPYAVHRVRLLRTVLASAIPSRWRWAAQIGGDIIIRLTVLVTILRIVWRGRHDTVCLGELMASGWLIRPLQALLGLRVIVYVHGEEVTMQQANDRARRRCGALLLRADGIVVVSRFTRKAVLDLIGHDRSGKVKLIPNGVASTRFTPGPKAPDLLRRHDIENAFVFLSICRLLEKKGIDQALRAFASLRNESCHISTQGNQSCDRATRRLFLVAGAGPFEMSLKNLVDELGIAADVRFAGAVPEHRLVDFYRLGNVFVMPNRALPNGDTEGFGLVFLEAGSCGLPVIAGRDGGTADAVRHGVNGLVVDGNSVPDIAHAMSRLSHDPRLRHQLRRNGLKFACSADWGLKVEEFLEFCDGLSSARWPARRLPTVRRTYRVDAAKQATAAARSAS